LGGAKGVFPEVVESDGVNTKDRSAQCHRTNQQRDVWPPEFIDQMPNRHGMSLSSGCRDQPSIDGWLQRHGAQGCTEQLRKISFSPMGTRRLLYFDDIEVSAW